MKRDPIHVANVLRNLRWDYELRKESIANLRTEIRRRERDRADREILIETNKIDGDFAAKVRKAIEEGVLVTEIQRDVLKTNSWTSWTKWRDLAGLPSRNQKSEEEWF